MNADKEAYIKGILDADKRGRIGFKELREFSLRASA
jgi:hypothetical protein